MPERFATVTTATATNALLPREVMAPMVPSAPNTFRQMLAANGLEALETDSTADISLPVASATAGGKVTETANSETENPPGFANSILLHPNMYQSGTTWYSNLVMNANNFDIVSATVPALYYSKELGLESDIVSTMIADGNITQNVTLAVSTGLTGFTYQNLVSLNRVLPKRYAYQKAIILSKNAYTAAENLVTTTGFPILNQDAQNSELKRFNGTPVLWSDYLAGFGANNIIGMVISCLGWKLRDCNVTNMIQRYTQSPGRPAQTGFNLFCAHAFGYDVNAVAFLKCPAS
jgi:HK97 family phage major capsid protein